MYLRQQQKNTKLINWIDEVYTQIDLNVECIERYLPRCQSANHLCILCQNKCTLLYKIILVYYIH